MWSHDSLSLGKSASSSHRGAELCHLSGMRSELGLCSANAASSPHPGGSNINQIPENLRSSAAQEAIDSEAQRG